MALSSASASSASSAHATEAAGCAAATMPGFSPAASSASASASGGSSTGSGPRRSPILVMLPIVQCGCGAEATGTAQHGSISSTGTTARRTEAGMSNPSGSDENTQAGIEHQA